MRRNIKKALSAVLIATMTLSTPIAVSENVTVVEAAEGKEEVTISDPLFPSNVKLDETLTGTEWWKGSQTGKEYVVDAENPSTEIYVTAKSLIDNYGAFNVELYTTDGKYFTTGSDKNAWIVDAEGTITPPIDETAIGSTLVEGHVYRITVTKSGKDVSVDYYDATVEKKYFSVTLSDSNFDDKFSVHIIAQVGTYGVGQKLVQEPILLDGVIPEESLKGTAYLEGKQTGKDYVIEGENAAKEIYVTAKDVVNGTGGFNVELYTADGKYFTTGSLQDAWIVGAKGTVSTVFTSGNTTLVEGHVYKITVKRSKQDLTVKYYDATAQEDYFEVTLKDSNFDDKFNVHIIAQIGTYEVGQQLASAVPFYLSVNGKTELKDEVFADGTIYWSTIKDEYHYADVVQLEADVKKGKAVNMTVINKATSEEIKTELVSLENGRIAVQFKMPASDIEVSSYGFGQIDSEKLENAVKSAKVIFDAGNDSKVEGIATVFVAETWNAFSTAYKTAKEVYDDVDERNQAEVLNSANDLIKAQKALVYNCIVKMQTADFVISSGATEALAVDITSNSKDPLKKTFTSSDEAVASVDENGTVTGVSMGKATITVTTEDGNSDSVAVKVYGDTSLIVGQKANYSFAPITDDATWTSSDEEVVSVSNGTAKAVATGTATITVKTADDVTYAFDVNVIDSLDCTVDAPLTSGVEVTDEGVYMTFKNTQNADAADNWNNPRMFIYSGNSPVMDKDPALRSDHWVDNVGSATNIGKDADWDAWKEECKKGVDCYASAVKVDGGIRVRLYVGSVWGEYIVPVEDGETYYVALTGGLCNITDLKVVTSREYIEPTIPVIISTPKPAATPGPEIDVPISSDDVTTDETLTGTAWWTGSQTGKDYVLEGDNCATELYIAAKELNGDYGAFNVEIYTSDSKYFTTGSDKNAWVAENATGTITPPINESAIGSTLVEGHVYRITVTRSGQDVTVKYYDATAQEDYFEVTLKDSNFDDSIMVHIMAQVGTFAIGQGVTVNPDATAKPSAEPTEAPSVEPTEAPSVEPSTEPTEAPATEAPSTEPTKAPSTEATKAPSKGDKINVSNNKFEVSSKSEVSYVAATKKDAAVVIPATVKVNGKVMKVTSISANAFKGNKAVKNITVSKNITKVGNNAFNGCKKLKTIVIKSTKLKASNISKKAFKGITKKTVIKVPKKKVKAYKKLFRSKGLSKSVKVKGI